MDEFLKGADRVSLEFVELSHQHRSQVGWKHPTHQGLVLGVDSHLMFELTYMLYRVYSAIIHGERWLVELSKKFYFFYPSHKG